MVGVPRTPTVFWLSCIHRVHLYPGGIQVFFRFGLRLGQHGYHLHAGTNLLPDPPVERLAALAEVAGSREASTSVRLFLLQSTPGSRLFRLVPTATSTCTGGAVRDGDEWAGTR